jgi:two-component system chemotaxis response regulator CheB
VIKVLVVDDSALMRKVLGDTLRAAGDFTVEVARDGLEAIERLHDFKPDVVTLDVMMPRMDGLACLDRIMVERPCPVLMLSARMEAGADVTLEAMSLGAVDFLPKPSGAISLALDDFAPEFVERVRSASRAHVSLALRLRERIRLRGNPGNSPPRPPGAMPSGAMPPGTAPASRPTPMPRGPRTARDGVVLVGISTGGPPALDVLLAPLPADFPWPIVIAQHMPATFTGPLSRRLDGICALRVTEVTRVEPLVPGSVYIGKGDADVVIGMRHGGPVVMPAPADPAFRWHPSTDRLVTSAMTHLDPARLIGVLMTGMGNDGAAAMTRLRAAGGHTIAEAEETAVIWGMPGELVRAGGAELVLPLDAIADQLVSWTA